MQALSQDHNSLSKKIEKIAHEYFDSRKEINSMGGFLNPSIVEKENPYSQFIEKVNTAYSSLNDVERLIINNDFFYQNYPNWWQIYYNKATYYRHKNSAMKRFLEAFENAS